MATMTLTLAEARLAGKTNEIRFDGDIDRVVFVAAGDATFTAERLLHRHREGEGFHCRGSFAVTAESEETTVWIWQLAEASQDSLPDGAVLKLRQDIEVGSGERVMRLDRVDFPPGAAALTHVHPGPGIRIVLAGRIGIQQGDSQMKYMSAGEPWFESGPDPVYAPTTEERSTTFIRCMVLPMEWRGRNTIRYVRSEDADKPKLQQYRRYVDATIQIPAARI